MWAFCRHCRDSFVRTKDFFSKSLLWLSKSRRLLFFEDIDLSPRCLLWAAACFLLAAHVWSRSVDAVKSKWRLRAQTLVGSAISSLDPGCGPHFLFPDAIALPPLGTSHVAMIVALLLLPVVAALCPDTATCISRVKEIVAAPRKWVALMYRNAGKFHERWRLVYFYENRVIEIWMLITQHPFMEVS